MTADTLKPQGTLETFEEKVHDPQAELQTAGQLYKELMLSAKQSQEMAGAQQELYTQITETFRQALSGLNLNYEYSNGSETALPVVVREIVERLVTEGITRPQGSETFFTQENEVWSPLTDSEKTLLVTAVNDKADELKPAFRQIYEKAKKAKHKVAATDAELFLQLQDLLYKETQRFIIYQAKRETEQRKSDGLSYGPSNRINDVFFQRKLPHEIAHFMQEHQLMLAENGHELTATPEELQMEVELALAIGRIDRSLTKIEVRQWLKNADKKSEIAGTPQDEAFLERLKDTYRSVKRRAGVLLVGPPGTGKTQFLEKLHKTMAGGKTGGLIPVNSQTSVSELTGAPGVLVENAQTANQEHEVPWAKGVLVSLLERGLSVTLDEVHKGRDSVLSALNHLLSSSNRAAIQIGNEQLHFPEQAKVSATANSLDGLSDAFLDRFTIIEVGYSSPEDVIKKMALHLMDQQAGVLRGGEGGEEIMTTSEQLKLVLFVNYLVPRIQAEYEAEQARLARKEITETEKIFNKPLSMRGLTDIAESIALGTPVDTAITTTIFTPNQLMKPSPLLNKLHQDYQTLTKNIRPSEPGSLSAASQAEQVLHSPIFELASHDTFAFDHRGVATKIELTASQKDRLLQHLENHPEPVLESRSPETQPIILNLSTGLRVELKAPLQGDYRTLEAKVYGGEDDFILEKRFTNQDPSQQPSPSALKITSFTPDGSSLMVRLGNKEYSLTLFDNKEATTLTPAQARCQAPHGEWSFAMTASRQATAAQFMPEGNEKGFQVDFALPLEKVESVQSSAGGKFVFIKAAANVSYLVPVADMMAHKTITIDYRLDPNHTWQMTNNIVHTQDGSAAYLLQ